MTEFGHQPHYLQIERALRARIDHAGRSPWARRDEKFSGSELIELTDDAIAGRLCKPDRRHQRCHADHDAEHS